MNRKALFFDIDGTLFSEIERQVPQSAVLALKKTRQCGNLVFINTGRTVCQTAGIQMEVESDGLLCGCGTYITTGNEVIYDRRSGRPDLRKISCALVWTGCWKAWKAATFSGESPGCRW